MKIDWGYSDRLLVAYNLLENADKQEYGEDVGKKEEILLKYFSELNTKKSTKDNVANFFEVLNELLEYINETGEYKNGRI